MIISDYANNSNLKQPLAPAVVTRELDPIELYEYDAVITCHTQPTSLVIPAGATEVSIRPLTKIPFSVNGLSYQSGSKLSRTWRTVGDRVVVTGRKLIQLEVGAVLHITFTSLKPLEPFYLAAQFLVICLASADERLPTQLDPQESALHLLADSLARAIATDPLSRNLPAPLLQDPSLEPSLTLDPHQRYYPI